MITDEQLREWKRLIDEATPGLWATNLVRLCDVVEANKQEPAIVVSKYIEDAAFIAAARTAVPKLIDEVERLRAIVRDLAAKEPRVLDNFDTCALCEAMEDGEGTIVHAESCPWRRAVEADGSVCKNCGLVMKPLPSPDFDHIKNLCCSDCGTPIR